MGNYKEHYSVLKKESIEYLIENCQSKDCYFADLTFGGGGHSLALAELGFKVIATDQDPEAIANGRKKIVASGYESKIELLHTNFSNFKDYVQSSPIEGFQGILMDLGVSSHHFDQSSRGFSFRGDDILDMRMNIADNSIRSARELLALLSESELEKIFLEYGEERYASRIAERIVEKRQDEAIEKTSQLEDIIFHCYPKKYRYGRINPATRCFQALRIAVNDELGVLERSIPELLPLLSRGGRLAIISFHSLEDRIVKHAYKKLAGDKYKIITKKPITPSEEEILENNRSRSAKLRVIESI